MSAGGRGWVGSKNKLTSVVSPALGIRPVGAVAAGQDDVAIHPGARLVDVLI